MSPHSTAAARTAANSNALHAITVADRYAVLVGKLKADHTSAGIELNAALRALDRGDTRAAAAAIERAKRIGNLAELREPEDVEADAISDPDAEVYR